MWRPASRCGNSTAASRCAACRTTARRSSAWLGYPPTSRHRTRRRGTRSRDRNDPTSAPSATSGCLAAPTDGRTPAGHAGVTVWDVATGAKLDRWAAATGLVRFTADSPGSDRGRLGGRRRVEPSRRPAGRPAPGPRQCAGRRAGVRHRLGRDTGRPHPRHRPRGRRHPLLGRNAAGPPGRARPSRSCGRTCRRWPPPTRRWSERPRPPSTPRPSRTGTRPRRRCSSSARGRPWPSQVGHGLGRTAGSGGAGTRRLRRPADPRHPDVPGARAVTAFERTATREALPVLDALAPGAADARLTHEAKAAADRRPAVR
ncbi:hypothetical protein PX52LOC_03362 [Limnoglobus roseus]|uniref:Uncharacterized protein n=1 Tax=Limnoglobus roseus TaxID=2598579 RepID=A0A5C1AAJ6_9BACT|nr:hypothetical protein PX52LOC_03362 [Limnoglobus roseus]